MQQDKKLLKLLPMSFGSMKNSPLFLYTLYSSCKAFLLSWLLHLMYFLKSLSFF